MIHFIIEQILLIISISLDNLIVSYIYSSQKIKISFLMIIIINTICTFSLFIAFKIGNIVSLYVNKNIINLISFFILLCIGIIKLLNNLVKILLNKIKYSNFILEIYKNAIKADKDFSNHLSINEAFALSISLSLDSFSVGLGLGINNSNYLLILILIFISGVVLFYIGKFIGQKLAICKNNDVNWISGIILILFSFIRLIKK